MAAWEVEYEAKSLKVLSDVFNGRIARVELKLGSELRLHGCQKPGWDSGSANLRAFRVEIAAKPLKMTAPQHDVALQALLSKRRRWRSSAWSGGCQRCREKCHAMCICMSETGHAIGLPATKGSGRHSEPSAQTFGASGNS